MKMFFAAAFLTLGGCSSYQSAEVEPPSVNRIPDVIVGFSAGSAAFNNVANVEKQLSGPGIVLVANANGDSFVLAEQRLHEITKNLLGQKEIYVSYRYSDRVADKDLVEVFGFQSSDEVPSILKQVNTLSLDSALGMRFSERQTRDLEYEVKRTTIVVPKADSPEIQLRQLLSYLGWELNGSIVLPDVIDNATVPHEMDVVLVDGSFVTGIELRSVIAAWLDIYGAADVGFSVAIDNVSKKVVLFQ